MKMSIRGEMNHFRLTKKLGGTVKSVEIEYDVKNAMYMAHVVFKNGRRVAHPEHLLDTDEFHALCVMIQDLPED
ncbi:MAG: hypothetical protein HC793_00370 [Aquincola sp.]|nr:hypothetical protein [Aquincola sp.]